MRNHSPALLCLLALCCGSAQARDWKTPQGKVSHQGEFVALRWNLVDLKLNDGNQVTVPLYQLSLEDHHYIEREEAARLGEPPEKLVIKPSVKWDTIHFAGNTPPPEQVLVVTLAAQSRALASATCVGDLQIDTFDTDAESPPRLSDSTDGAKGRIDRVQRSPAYRVVPPHGFFFDIKFTAHEKPLSRIRRLQGSFKIITGEPHLITVKQAPKAKNLALVDPVLTELGMAMVVNDTRRASATLTFPGMGKRTIHNLDITGKHDWVFQVVMTDTDGYRLKPSGGFAGSDKRTRYEFEFPPPGPADAHMRITVLKNPREERVPFDLTDLEVPAYSQEAAQRRTDEHNALLKGIQESPRVAPK